MLFASRRATLRLTTRGTRHLSDHAPAAAVAFSTTDSIPGSKGVQFCGLAEGSTVRAKNVGHDLLAGFRQIVGGEITSYTDLLQEARAEAMSRLADDATAKGGNAVIGLRLVSSSVSTGASEILAYGTAVRVE